MDRTTLAGRGRRRRKLAAAALVVGAIAAAVPLFSTAGAASPASASSDINDYALFASQSIKLKGGDSSGRSIINGNVGVGTASAWDATKPYIKSGANSATLGEYRLQLCEGQSNKHTTLGPDNYLASPSIDIGPGDCSSIKEAFGYQLRGLPVAVKDLPFRAWTNPDVLIRLQSVATKLKVNEAEQKTISIRASPTPDNLPGR